MSTSESASASAFRADALASRVALVTGGGSGIGLGIATRLGQHGARVVLMGRRDEVLADARAALRRQGIAAEVFRGDVRSEADARGAVEFAERTFGKLDTVVNCAAGNFLSLAEKLSTKGFSTVMEIDAVGTFNVSRQAFDELKRSKQGCIINITATFQYGAAWFQVHASAAKSAIDSMTRSLALEWGQHNIRVNGVAPGPIADTPGYTKLVSPEGQPSVLGKVALGRLGTTREIGDACVFLCSSAASYVTGATLVVDGGEWFGGPVPVSPDKVAEYSRGVESKSRDVGKAKPKL